MIHWPSARRFAVQQLKTTEFADFFGGHWRGFLDPMAPKFIYDDYTYFYVICRTTIMMIIKKNKFNQTWDKFFEIDMYWQKSKIEIVKRSKQLYKIQKYVGVYSPRAHIFSVENRVCNEIYERARIYEEWSIMYIIYLAHIKMIYRLNTEIHVNKFWIQLTADKWQHAICKQINSTPTFSCKEQYSNL